MVFGRVQDEAAEKKKRFLELLPECRSIRIAAHRAGIARTSCYDWRKHDPEFAAEFERVKREIADDLEAELLRRAMEGKGQMPDTLGIFLLKGYKPEFRDSYTVRNESVNVSLMGSIEALPAEHRRRLLELALGRHQEAAALPEPAEEPVRVGAGEGERGEKEDDAAG